MSTELIISCALTGNVATPDNNPHLPFNPEAIGRAAIEAWKEGAAIVHIHGRRDDGTPTAQPEYFRRALDVIRSADCDVIINLTTAHTGLDEDIWEERFACLVVQPEIASFDCGSMNFGDRVFRNTPEFLDLLARRMHDAGVKPELEIFDFGQLDNALRIHQAGLLAGPLFFQLVLGVPGGIPATARNLIHLVDALPDRSLYSVCALGRHQLPMNTHAVAMGGHARTGLEDNLWYRKGVPATNGMLVERVRTLGETLGRTIATPAQAREMLAIAPVVSAE